MAVQNPVTVPEVGLSRYRADFPVLSTQMNGKPLAFLDSAASAQKPLCVIEAMNCAYKEEYSNIHRGLYKISQELTEKFELVRSKISNFIGAKSSNEIIFTHNATEGINLVAQTWGRRFLKEGDEVILSEMEHHANIVPWQLLRDQVGIVIKTIPFDERGVLDLEAFEKLLTPRTKLVSVVHVSNVLGTVNPVKEIVRIAKDFYPQLVVLIDGSQGIVHAPVNVQEIGADFYVFTGHKLYGPAGVGVLHGKYDVLASMPPYQGGGDMIETVSFDYTEYKKPPYRFEAGTPAIVDVIGLGAAVDYLVEIGMDKVARHEQELLSYAAAKIVDIEGLSIRGTAQHKAPVISFTMDCAHSSDIGMVLDQCGVAVRTGHHCCMPLMAALGVDSTVRASFGLYSNKEDVDQLVGALEKVKDLFG